MSFLSKKSNKSECCLQKKYFNGIAFFKLKTDDIMHQSYFYEEMFFERIKLHIPFTKAAESVVFIQYLNLDWKVNNYSKNLISTNKSYCFNDFSTFYGK